MEENSKLCARASAKSSLSAVVPSRLTKVTPPPPPRRHTTSLQTNRHRSRFRLYIDRAKDWVEWKKPLHVIIIIIIIIIII